MKKTLILAASFCCITAFAQGKVGFSNNSLHLVYWGPSTGTYFGQAVNSDNAPQGLPPLMADLYMGTSSSELFLYSSATFQPLAGGPGRWAFQSVQAGANPTTGAPGIPSGTVFVAVAVLSTEKPAPNMFDSAAFQTYAANGITPEFSFVLGTGITYPVLYGANNLGTWPTGTLNMDQYGVGSRGAIEVNIIPEPSTLALAGLGVAAFLLFRRRK